MDSIAPTHVYLDQNVLSDLRDRKLMASGDKTLLNLKALLKSHAHGLILVYSFCHLNEIAQISNTQYVDEHIDLLDDLEGIYIEPGTSRLNYASAKAVWHGHVENSKDSKRLGFDKAYDVSELLMKKLAGLPVGSSFREIADASSDAVMNILRNAEDSLMSLLNTSQSSEREVADLAAVKASIQNIRRQALEMTSLPEIPQRQLGPAPLRTIFNQRVPNLLDVAAREVVPTIETLFNEAQGGTQWKRHAGEGILGAITCCYILMNWAGYYPDDFTSTKKGRDRMHASHNDLTHAINAAGAHYLVSMDTAFLKKAEACYAHLGFKTKVMNPTSFLGEWLL